MVGKSKQFSGTSLLRHAYTERGTKKKKLYIDTSKLLYIVKLNYIAFVLPVKEGSSTSDEIVTE